MKKKYVIEVEETNHKSGECFNKEQYPKSGWYLNTNEMGTKALILIPSKLENLPIGLYDWGAGSEEIETLLGEPLQEIPEVTELESLPEIQTGVSENALLKAIAIAQNPELAKDLV